MDITFHGGAMEVGRCCFEVKVHERRILIDSGIKLANHNVEFPITIPNMNYIQNVFLSHVHLDHTGALPLFYAQGLRCAVYCSEVTKLILPVLLKDSWKIARIEKRVVGYRKSDVKEILKLVMPVEEDKNNFSEFDVAGAKVQMIDAGHVPGSRATFFDFGDETLLYTGDISLTNTRLTPPADLERFPHSNILIIESTYGSREHPDRKVEEKRFLDMIDRTLDKGGSVLIPTFAIGRSQEMLLILEEKGYFDKVPIFFDGMGKRITKDMIHCLDNGELARCYNKVNLVETRDDRNHVMKEQCIVVTTSGMLDGGPIMEYLKRAKSQDAILLTGYQAEGTNGRRLMAEGRVDVDGRVLNIKSSYDKFDFSSHAGAGDLHKIIEKVNPKHVILVHGDDESLIELAKFVEKFGATAHIPKLGETIHIAKA